MGAGRQIVAFPVILPWREEFWTLPLYFPHLKVGVVPGWPPQLPYQGIPLPPDARAPIQEYKGYQPGELRQWQAYADFRESQEDMGDLLQSIRQYGEPEAEPAARKPVSAQAWSLAWQLEKMSADQEAQLLLVDQGQDWLREILAPEAWEEKPAFASVPGVGEMVDPEMAKLRYRLWERVMAEYLEEAAVPLLLGRTSRSLFLSLRGWPQWTDIKMAQVALPGCRNAQEWQAICGQGGSPPWREGFVELLEACLSAAETDFQELQEASRNLEEFTQNQVAAQWPLPLDWKLELEIWMPDHSEEEEGAVLCWRGAGDGVLPG